MKKFLIVLLAVTQLSSCNNAAKTEKTKESVVNVPVFSADSAYKFVKQQVGFGARIPNTSAHRNCKEYLTTELKRFGARVIEQKAELTAFDGTKLESTNIIGSYNPGSETRILLFSHWDSRPWADNDPNPANHQKPVMGANDGASGVGILLEMARLMSQKLPSVGVDIIFFDAEDYGAPENAKETNTENTWCLGTQYWANNPHEPGYRARYGILLDMVGAPGATFYKEQASVYFANSVVDKVWSKANNLGFGKYFINQQGGAVTDDHIYVNQIIGIPSIDIIDFDPNKNGFGSYWHTINDTMDNVDKNTLLAVGTTLLHVVYSEK